MIATELLAAYDASRAPGTDRSVLCHAPFVSLNFDQSGRVTACCFNRQYVLGTYPQQTVREIWTGAPAQALREAFVTGANAEGCDRCFDQLKNRNFSGALMKNFDRYTARGAARPAGSDGLPLVLEFEISNTCTLECVMCGGHWSSAIRKNREKLPPIQNPYDRTFVEQIEEFLPTIAAAKFLGGEPFLINRYHEIWDSIRRLNPDAQISITTSGAVVPERSRQMLEQLRANIVVSLDGITKATYESIRRNAVFEEVMENITYFRAYTRRRHTSLTVAVCPMTHNWRELRAIVDFCEERQITVFFNTVTFPVESSLAGLAEPELADVIERLETGELGAQRSWTAATRDQWQGLTNQLHGWMDEKRAFSRHCADVARAARSFAAVHLGNDEHARSLQRIEALIEPLVLANEVHRERARAQSGHGTRDGALLPQSPLALWPADSVPGARDLLLAAHVVRRFVTGVNDGHPETDRPGVVDEHRQLCFAMDRMLDVEDTRSSFDRIGQWIRERLLQADVRPAFDIIQTMLDSGDTRHLLLMGEPAELQRRIDGGWQSLGVDDMDETERSRIQGHFDRLVAFHSLVRLLGTGDTAGGVEATLVRRIRDVPDLRAALHAAQLFHLCFGPAAKHESFRRRLDTVRGALTPERAAAIISALQKSDVTQMYTFMSTVSDQEFAGAMGAVTH